MNTEVETIHEKGDGKVNEDELLRKENTFGVFDGATSLHGFKDNERNTGAKIAACIAKETFSQEDESLESLAKETNRKIKKIMEREGIDTDDKEKCWATSASVVRLRKEKAEYFNITDSFILVIKEDGSYELPVKPHNHDMETLRKWKRLADQGKDNIREKIMPEIKKIRKKANKDYGFLNGDKKAEQFFKTGDFDLKNVKTIILATDGLYIPKKDPKADEKWEKFIEIYNDSGLEGIKKYIREKEESDPECKEYIRTKTHDDMAGIAIEFE